MLVNKKVKNKTIVFNWQVIFSKTLCLSSAPVEEEDEEEDEDEELLAADGGLGGPDEAPLHRGVGLALGG